MRRFRLNGWQRVGIVLSVVWVIVGGTWGWRHANDQTDANFRVCIAAIQTASDLQSCRETRFRALATKGNSAAFVALAPILVVWLLVYALVALVRWIRRGKVLPMLDFDRLNDQLDRAGYDLDKVHELYDQVHTEIEAAPPDQRPQLEARLLELCHRRAELAKRLLDAHMGALKA